MDFFKVLLTFRGCFLSGLDGFKGIISSSKTFFNTTCRFWEKSIFLLQKLHFLASNRTIGLKIQFFTKKSLFFKVLQTSRGCFLPGLGRIRDIVSTSKAFFDTTSGFWEKLTFCRRKCISWPKTIVPWVWGEKSKFSVKNRFFLKNDMYYQKILWRSKQYP